MIDARTCPCGAPITRQSRTGRCRPCASRAALADGVNRERRLAALRAAKATPEHRERARAARERTEQERADDPKWKAYKRASGRRLQAQYRASPDAQAKRLAAMDGVGIKVSDHRLAWCPREHRDAYRALREKDVPAPEARRMIETEIPGTLEHARRQIANTAFAAHLREERRQLEAY